MTLKASARLSPSRSILNEATEVPPEEVHVPQEQAASLSLLTGEYRAALHWYTLTNGCWMLKVLDGEGNVVDGGLGDDPVDALLEVAERLMPPSAADS